MLEVIIAIQFSIFIIMFFRYDLHNTLLDNFGILIETIARMIEIITSIEFWKYVVSFQWLLHWFKRK